MSNISGLEIKLCDFWLRDLVMRSHDLMISCKIRSIYREGEGEKQFVWKNLHFPFPSEGPGTMGTCNPVSGLHPTAFHKPASFIRHTFSTQIIKKIIIIMKFA